MTIQEVLTPHLSPIDITRCDQWTLIAIHPGSVTPHVIREIAPRVTSHEHTPWLRPFLGPSLDVPKFLASPIAYLEARSPGLLHVPCQPHYIPEALRAPWGQV